jgi:hypothetical protein
MADPRTFSTSGEGRDDDRYKNLTGEEPGGTEKGDINDRDDNIELLISFWPA